MYMAAPKPDLRDVERSLRSLQLPVDPTLEHKAPKVANAQLNEQGVPTSEQPDTVASDLREWETRGRPPLRLKLLVEAILKECAGVDGDALAAGYFGAHKDLTERCELDFNAAKTLLSASRLVIHLITNERMSCAQAARVLSAPMRGSAYNWEQVRSLATRLGVAEPTLSADATQEVYVRDRDEEVTRFADSTPELELELLLDASRVLGFSNDAQSAFSRLLQPNFDAALMTLLHFVLTVCELYDHPPAVVYEFKPRGEAMKSLQARNPLYAARGSAALNVAKAAVALDDRWAWGRKGNRRGDALALVAIFQGLEQMHYPARRELASWLRQWIVRMHARNSGNERWLDGVSAGSDAIQLIEALAAQPTHTSGTIEQRVVDALTVVLHPHEEWVSRGRKDSVCATNTSRKKMGDCEYVRRSHTSIAAYEAHAGIVTDAYIDEHAASLEKVINARSEDLEARAPVEAWNILVTFVAHQSRASRQFEEKHIGDFVVGFEVVDYAEMLERVQSRLDSLDDGLSQFVGAVNDNVVGPLNEIWTPQSTRDCVTNRLDKYVADHRDRVATAAELIMQQHAVALQRLGK